MRPREAPHPRPEIFGLDENGIRNAPGFIGLAILITDSMQISIKRNGAKAVTYFWLSQEGLIIMPDTVCIPEEKHLGETHEQERGVLEGRSGAKGVFFYTMLPVEPKQ